MTAVCFTGEKTTGILLFSTYSVICKFEVILMCLKNLFVTSKVKTKEILTSLSDTCGLLICSSKSSFWPLPDERLGAKRFIFIDVRQHPSVVPVPVKLLAFSCGASNMDPQGQAYAQILFSYE